LTGFVTEGTEELRRNELLRQVQEEKEEVKTRGKVFLSASLYFSKRGTY